MLLTTRNQELWRVNKYLWISLGFIGIWLWGRQNQFDPFTQGVLAWLFLAGLLNTGVRTFLGFRSKNGTTGLWGWAFSIVDIVVVAFAVRLTGGLDSDLWLLYFLLIITETLSVLTKAELLLIALVFLGYAASLWPIRDWGAFGIRIFFLYVTAAIARRLYRRAEARNRQLALLREQLSLEEEKGRVARELHDGIGREIVNVILGLEVARRVAEKNPHEAPEMIAENIAILRTAMDDTRQLIFQTRPLSMEADTGETLGLRIERYARQFAERTGLVVDVLSNMGDQALSPPMAFGVLRIVQEALNNIAKHARAAHVKVSLACDGSFLTAEVTDDGIGFIPTDEHPGAGIGLKAIVERARELRGEAKIVSAPGKGTQIIARLPVS